MAELLEIEEPVPSVLLPCTSCNRTFRPDALAKHAKVCEKTLMKKRKKFDSAKQRIQGTELAQFLPTVGMSAKKPACKTEPQSRWKEKDRGSGETVSTVKRTISRRKSEDNKPSDHDRCPYCERFFGPKAFDRHTEWCKEQSTRVQTKTQSCLEAKERLQARTKYRAPLTKTQRALTKEHYSPMRANRDPSPQISNNASPIRKSPESPKDVSNPAYSSPSFSRNTPQRSSSKYDPPIRSSSIPAHSKMFRPTQSRSNTSSSTTKESSRDYDEGSGNRAKPKVVNRRNSIDKRDLDKYDPYVSAELQMLELFSEENKTNNNVQQKEQKGGTNGDSLPSLDNTPILIRSSPSSAFAKFSPISPDCSPPIPNNDECHERNDNIDNSRRGSNMSLSNISLCSVISLDSIDCNRNTSKNSGRSQSVAEPIKPVSRHAYKTKPDMHQMLYGSSPFVPVENEKNTTLSSTNSSKEDLETCEAELLISMMEFEKMLSSSSPLPPTSDSSPPILHLEPSSNLCSSNQLDCGDERTLFSSNNNEDDIEIHRPTLQGHNVDSAYSSLTRKTPVEGNGADPSHPEFAETSRFCHECGARYPIQAAKFCCQCGIRRLAI